MIRSVAVTAANGGAAPSTVRMGNTIRLYAQATRNDGTKEIVSENVTWDSKDKSKAIIATDGTVTPVAVGTARISAAIGDIISTDFPVTVTAPTA